MAGGALQVVMVGRLATSMASQAVGKRGQGVIDLGRQPLARVVAVRAFEFKVSRRALLAVADRTGDLVDRPVVGVGWQPVVLLVADRALPGRVSLGSPSGMAGLAVVVLKCSMVDINQAPIQVLVAGLAVVFVMINGLVILVT